MSLVNEVCPTWTKPWIAVCLDEALVPLLLGSTSKPFPKVSRDQLDVLLSALKRGEADEIHFTLAEASREASSLRSLKPLFGAAKKAKLKIGLTVSPKIFRAALKLGPDFLCIDFQGKGASPKSAAVQRLLGSLKASKKTKTTLAAQSTDPKLFKHLVEQGFEMISLPHSAPGLRALCKIAIQAGLRLSLCETTEAADPEVLRTVAAWEDAPFAIRISRYQVGSYFFRRALVTGYEAATREAVSAICAP